MEIAGGRGRLSSPAIADRGLEFGAAAGEQLGRKAVRRSRAGRACGRIRAGNGGTALARKTRARCRARRKTSGNDSAYHGGQHAAGSVAGRCVGYLDPGGHSRGPAGERQSALAQSARVAAALTWERNDRKSCGYAAGSEHLSGFGGEPRTLFWHGFGRRASAYRSAETGPDRIP